MILPPFFNPSNDMALAANVSRYTPPRRIRQMEEELAGLSRFWDAGPWGWSLAARAAYLRMGIPPGELPSDEWLAGVRRLSGREFGVAYYEPLADEAHGCPSLLPCRARYVTDWDGVLLPPAGGGLILKAPWSSSGRGNIVLRDQPDATTLRRIRRIIAEQGGIVVEPYYADKVLDFAMEFWVEADGPDVRFLGYSVFEADGTGRYGGNYVESQNRLLQRIALPNHLLQHLVDYHRQRLAVLPYHGPVGIDMMKIQPPTGGILVHPCVELNFRMTMGLLALRLYERGLTGDQWLTPWRDHGFVAGIQNGRLTITYLA